MWKKIGVKNINDQKENSKSQRESKGYKRYLPLREIVEPNKFYRSNSYNSLHMERTLFSEETMFQMHEKHPYPPLLSPKATSTFNDKELVSILKRRNQTVKSHSHHIQEESDIYSNDQQNGFLKSVSTKKFFHSFSKRSSIKPLNTLEFEMKFNEKAKLKSNTDHIMDEIVKLRTQLKIAVETNKLYKKMIQEFKISFQDLSSTINHQFNNMLKVCSQAVIEASKVSYRAVESIPKMDYLKPLGPQSSVESSRRSSIKLNNSSCKSESIDKILCAVQSIKLNILKKSFNAQNPISSLYPPKIQNPFFVENQILQAITFNNIVINSSPKITQQS